MIENAIENAFEIAFEIAFEKAFECANGSAIVLTKHTEFHDETDEW